VGKRKCKRPLDLFAEETTDVDLETTATEAMVDAPEVVLEADPPGAGSGTQSNDQFAALVSVVSQLAGQVHATQKQIGELRTLVTATHPAAPRAPVPDSDASMSVPGNTVAGSMAAQGAIPKRGDITTSCRLEAACPSLAQLRHDADLAAQATAMMNTLELDTSGNNSHTHSNLHSTMSRSMRRGWARPGGDSAPRVPVPWPQDYVMGHGRKNRLLYDDLDVYNFVQGCLSIITREDNVDIMRLMITQLSATMRDAMFHGFEAARYSYGIILSMMEDGLLNWSDSSRVAEERRSALIAHGSQPRAAMPPVTRRAPNVGPQRGNNRGSSSSARDNNVPRPCNFYNAGTCSQRGDHVTGGTFWKHVCKRCLAPDHIERDCPLQSPGTRPS
jgi:hypothetical protein